MVWVVVDNQRCRRVVSVLCGILGHNSMDLHTTILRHYLLLHPVLEVDEAEETLVDGNVFEHSPDQFENQSPSFGSTGLVSSP
jgi:hypothetical protein